MSILRFIPGWTRFVKTIKNINDASDSVVKITETTDKTLTYVTKVTGVSCGTSGIAKGSVDVMEAIACQDGLCAVVSAVGVGADALSIAASFIPGPNITTVITVPVSVGCKVFVHCCKKAKKMPWGC